MVNVGGENLEDSPDYGDRAELFEPTVSDRNIGIKIRSLTKVNMYAVIRTMSGPASPHNFTVLIVASNRVKSRNLSILF